MTCNTNFNNKIYKSARTFTTEIILFLGIIFILLGLAFYSGYVYGRHQVPQQHRPSLEIPVDTLTIKDTIS